MRRDLVEALVRHARTDERVVMLTGDLGFAALEPFIEAFPERFFNAGVAEQNMIGMATGLAEAGLTPYVYSIATFASMRGFEFLRNGAVLHCLPVRVIGIGEGVDYGHNGMTHYALEDVALMRSQPGLAIVTPAESAQVGPIIDAVQALPGPAYIRLSKADAVVPGLEGRFTLGRAETLGEGSDVVIVALGAMTSVALRGAELLAEQGVSAGVVSVSSVSPAPVEDLEQALSSAPLVVGLEAHYATGGLGSLLAEIIAEHGIDTRLIRAGIHRLPLGVSGGSGYMFDQLGISAGAVVRFVLDARGSRSHVR